MNWEDAPDIDTDIFSTKSDSIAGVISADKHMADIIDEVIESLARTILPAIQEYYDSRKCKESLRSGKKKMKTYSHQREMVKHK